MHGDKNIARENEVALVPAPGGPRPKGSVRPVAPGETVRRNPDGTYSVLPEQPAETEKKETENG